MLNASKWWDLQKLPGWSTIVVSLNRALILHGRQLPQVQRRIEDQRETRNLGDEGGRMGLQVRWQRFISGGSGLICGQAPSAGRRTGAVLAIKFAHSSDKVREELKEAATLSRAAWGRDGYCFTIGGGRTLLMLFSLHLSRCRYAEQKMPPKSHRHPSLVNSLPRAKTLY